MPEAHADVAHDQGVGVKILILRPGYDVGSAEKIQRFDGLEIQRIVPFAVISVFFEILGFALFALADRFLVDRVAENHAGTVFHFNSPVTSGTE